MQTFEVDDDLAMLVERLAKERPFEQLTFNDALRRLLKRVVPPPDSAPKRDDLEDLLAESMPAAKLQLKKSPSPSVSDWVASVPELKARKGLSTWKAICDLLRIDTAGDSARRRLKNWVRANRPTWPPVPDID